MTSRASKKISVSHNHPTSKPAGFNSFIARYAAFIITSVVQ